MNDGAEMISCACKRSNDALVCFLNLGLCFCDAVHLLQELVYYSRDCCYVSVMILSFSCCKAGQAA